MKKNTQPSDQKPATDGSTADANPAGAAPNGGADDKTTEALRKQLKHSHEREDRLITELQEKEHVLQELEEDLTQAYTRKSKKDATETVSITRALAETPLIPPRSTAPCPLC